MGTGLSEMEKPGLSVEDGTGLDGVIFVVERDEGGRLTEEVGGVACEGALEILRA
jgi:hypothetical protein